jgi:hypothetical protein
MLSIYFQYICSSIFVLEESFKISLKQNYNLKPNPPKFVHQSLIYVSDKGNFLYLLWKILGSEDIGLLLLVGKINTVCSNISSLYLPQQTSSLKRTYSLLTF